MFLVVPKAVAISLKAVPSIRLDRHSLPLLLEVGIQDVGIQHSTQDQRVDESSLWFEVWVDLLDCWDVVLDDVVTNQHLSVFKDLQPFLWVLKQLRLVPRVDRTAVNRSDVPHIEGIGLHIERYRR